MFLFADLAQWVNQSLPENLQNLSCSGFQIDSRKILPGDCFIALPGKNNHGITFIEEAAKNGAVAAIVDQPVNTQTSIPTWCVNNTLDTLHQLARAWRQQLINIYLIGITGSCGKTSTKNFTGEILKTAFGDDAVFISPGNYNSLTGVPLALLKLKSHHKYAVLEFGMDQFGEISKTSSLAQPNCVAITMASPAHVSNVGDLAGVARAKAELLEHLDSHGTAVLNYDSDFFEFWQNKLKSTQQLKTFSKNNNKNNIIYKNIITDFDHCSFDLLINNKNINIKLRSPLMIQAMNAACAATIATVLSITSEIIKKALENSAITERRFQKISGVNNCVLIDDGYNANPASVQAAIDTLCYFSGKKILVLGTLLGLGEQSVDYHKKIGEYILAKNIDYLFTYGEFTDIISTIFAQNNYKNNNYHHYNHPDQLLTNLKPFLDQNTAVIVKASLDMNAKYIVDQLRA